MRASRGEICIEEILEEAGLPFKMEYSFEGLNSSNGRPLRFDFAVFDDDGNIDFLIEYQGRQHYEPSAKYGGKKQFRASIVITAYPTLPQIWHSQYDHPIVKPI